MESIFTLDISRLYTYRYRYSNMLQLYSFTTESTNKQFSRNTRSGPSRNRCVSVQLQHCHRHESLRKSRYSNESLDLKIKFHFGQLFSLNLINRVFLRKTGRGELSMSTQLNEKAQPISLHTKLSILI